MSDVRVTSLTIHNPHYGEGGRPFTVRAIGQAGELEESFWTQGEAWERRDQLLDAGYHSVRVLGAPTIITVVG
jgi:hypothetical protein